MKFAFIFAFFVIFLTFSVSHCKNHKFSSRRKLKKTKGCNKFITKLLPDVIKATIVTAHNVYRSLIAKGEAKASTDNLPKASNMNQMYWSDDLAKMAQDWADNCEFSPSPSNKRVYKNYTLGENIFTYASKSAVAIEDYKWKEAVLRWYSEISLLNEDDIAPYVKKRRLNIYHNWHGHKAS